MIGRAGGFHFTYIGCLPPYPLVFLSRPPPDVRRVEIGYTPVYLGTKKQYQTLLNNYGLNSIFNNLVEISSAEYRS